jgi:AcrR family transcriptional regulator
MDDTPPRRRAPGMSPERRREMIVAAALPLVAEHGATLTTAAIARAAGIGEATIFRVFADKDELLDACIAEVTRPDTALDGIAAIPLDEPLDVRLVEAGAALQAYLRRMGDVLGALWGARPNRVRPAPDEGAARRRTESADAVIDAVAALFEPDADSLRLPARQLAQLFTGQLFNRGPRAPMGAELSVEQVVDLFLNGALSREAA